MGAINPAYKKRFILDVYTSQANLTEQQFLDIATQAAIEAEFKLNQDNRLRWHLKETAQEAE